jgi:hypothetical protein
MIVLTLQEALKNIGETRLSEDLEYMSEETYKLWYRVVLLTLAKIA